MREFAHAKVNLFLHVTGRRADGYHLLDSLAVFVEAADTLECSPAETLSLSVVGPFGPLLQGEDADRNLVLRAVRAWARQSGAPAAMRLTLDKHLPIASGIGGGSADAAATLRLIERSQGVRLAPARLHGLAAALGADVPVCLAQNPARMGGAGEILRPAPLLPELGLALVNCGEAVSTQAVFRAWAEQANGFTPAAELPRGWSDVAGLAASLGLLSNDLEAPARRLCPAIGTALEILAALPGCRFARMSGSGATCFGLFDTAAAARAALAAAALPVGWWCWGGGLHRSEGWSENVAGSNQECLP